VALICTLGWNVDLVYFGLDLSVCLFYIYYGDVKRRGRKTLR